jgi:hypothetical protein
VTAFHDHEVAALIDDETELDAEVIIEARGTVQLAKPTANVAAAIVDPFAEKFEEEEVVLDNFAAWDDMFQRDVPKVENRRDPGFSTMVQAAIEASPVSADAFVTTSTISGVDTAPSRQVDRPRLRLADVPDGLAVDRCSSMQVAAPKASSAESLQNLLAAFSAAKVEAAVTVDVADELPVLVIEEDAPQNSPPPPVRREEYRNLFSRLRSG